MRHRQWRKQGTIDDAENRGVRADSERQRQNRNRRESRILPQDAKPKLHVGPNPLDRTPSPNISSVALGQRKISKLPPRLMLSFPPLHPPAHQFLDALFQMPA